MQVRAFATALVAGLGATACGGGGLLSVQESIVETRELEPGGRFELENVNGRVHVATWTEPRVRIEADKAASSRSALRNLRIDIDGEGSRVKVRTRHSRGSWLFGGGGGKVDYRITVPAGARVSVETVNGRVEIEGVTGDLRAATTNGGVEISGASGVVVATSVNGSINTGYGTLTGEGDHRFSTVNGSITVLVPEGTGGRLEAQTVNGSVDSDLRLESSERATRRRLVGRLGQGRGSLKLETVNGSIRLRRR
jgi:DUF4097 and DUF4098 domain-containing protein YvlB